MIWAEGAWERGGGEMRSGEKAVRDEVKCKDSVSVDVMALGRWDNHRDTLNSTYLQST